MPATVTTGMLTVNLGPDLLTAAKQYAEINGCELAGIVRKALAREIGRKDLATAVKRGRPKKVEWCILRSAVAGS